ncbi:PREDICTED: Cold regulated gene 27 [Prunus dulcis]|uniref:PREDICTED: Cold regulated gene 27 n=1 Tax=Prunus dulcis TaxID=3755 RepID=A0A5E4EWR0_PRUDU|nr:cold-regulated protein 28 isoform X3 [Prunus dulcis]VVA18178.1 PREDICTED: Cold regulated gene 27 [Prunus dulcis]
MGENIRENIPLPNSDPERRPELTRTISNSSSSSSFSFTTLDASEELPLCCSHATLGASTEWTNEKHNLYLDSLETSFVNELYHSMRLRDWHQQKNARGTHSLQEVSFKTQNSSDQFMVVQDGCLQKINLRKNESLMESTANSHVTVRSPCRCHSTLAGKSCTVSSSKTLTLKKLHASARSSEQNLVCHQDLVGSITEVSGQNFVDEDHGGKLSNASKPKRLKRVAADASSNDQIVPSGNFDTKEVSMAHNVLSEQGHNLRYFLGGS